MRRVLGLILAALVVLAGVAGLGAFMVARAGPETLRARAQEELAALLGTEVEIGPVELRLARTGLVAAAHGLRAWEGAEGATLSAERIELQLDPWALLAGEVDVGWIAVHGALLRLRREGDGVALALPPGAALPAASGARPGGALERVLAHVPQIELRGGSAVVAQGPANLPPVVFEELDGAVARRWLRGGAALELAGALRSRGEPAGRFALSAVADGGWRASARVDELALGALASLAPAPVRARMPTGRASGTLELKAPERAAPALRFALDAPRLRLPASAAQLERVRVDGTLRAADASRDGTRWALDARARASGVEVPLAAEALQSASGALRRGEVALGGPVEIARLGPFVEALPEALRGQARDVVRHVRGGRLVEAQLGWDAGGDARALRARARVEGLLLEVGAGRFEDGAGELAFEGGVLQVREAGGFLRGEPARLAELLPEPARAQVGAVLARVDAARLADVELRWPFAAATPLEDAALRARLGETAVRVGARSRLEALAGQVAYESGALTLAGVSGRIDGRPLPALEARVENLGPLFAGLRCVEPEPVPPLPGRRPLAEWVRGPQDRRGGPPSWQRVRIEAEWLAHPALGCVVDDLAGTLEPLEGGGLRLAIERAAWAGHGLRGVLEHRAEAPESVRIEARFGAPPGKTRTEAPAGAWARGRFHLASQRLGKWKARSAQGGFLLHGVELALDGVRLQLDPDPELAAEIGLELTREDAVPFHADARAVRGDFGDLLLAITDTTEPSVSGGFVGAISLRGALRPGHPTLGGADGGFSLHLRDGVIRQRFRLLLAVAMASETLNPFREQGTIRFGAMDVVGTLTRGTWVAETLQIDGPALRVLAHGRVGAVSPHPVEGVMGLFFFRTLDRAIGLVPFLNRMLLGEDRNLLGAYVALSGPWSGVSARVLPVKSLARGPASVVLEGVPTALQEGVRAIERMLGAVSPPAPDARAPLDTSAAPGKAGS